ncbi:lytic transglycosylase domain-containing protein [Caldovatus aquaticus]|uniref:Lytic transglycosylase domain-containing protein n=1 Tax=Caldovatus aquaticus TaxID=2865671 RepID=A0ABS7EY69_9PROT|nr:lytic transglycosylase domain-containing protein [Caldovatus aquaticus]MBW8268284.1 lytic transglycosylase domain-containing protein [Caldovatus aquaticus]
MSGSLPREERTVLPQGAGVVDLGRTGEVARRATAQAFDVAGVLDPLASLLERERTQEAIASGEAAGASEPIERDAEGRIVVPDLSRRPFERIAERRRREVLTSRYASEFLLDSQGEIQRLRQQHADDPEAFRQAAERWRQGTLSALPPELRLPVGEGIGRLIGQHYGNLLGQRAARDRQEARRLSEQALGRLGGEAFDLILQGRDPAPVLASLRAKIAQDTGGVWDRGEAAEIERRLLVVAPLQARLQRELRGGAGAALLGDGPERFGARLPEGWRPIVAAASAETGLPERLLREVFGLESGGDPNAVSRAGAVGAAQIMAATARDPGFGLPPLRPEDRSDPAKAIPWGARYLRALLDHYGGDLRLALAAYNAGPGRVDEHLRTGRPLPEETRRYLANLLPGAGSGPGGAADTVEAGRIVEALRAGPGAPGWREEWNGLTPQERQQLAAFGDALVREQRQEITWREQRTRLAASRVMADRAMELAEMERQRRPDGTLPPALVARRSQIERELHEIGRVIGADWGADVARRSEQADRAAEGRAAAEAVMQFRRERALAALGVTPDAQPAGEVAEVLRRIQGLPLAAQVDILETFTRDRAQALRLQQQQAERWQRFAEAMRPGDQQGPQVENNREYQAIALDWIRGEAQAPFTDPGAQARIVQAARAGVLPEQVVGFMLGALESRDPRTYAAAAAIHQALEADPQARRVYHAQLDEKSRRAFEGVAEQLRSIPEEGFEQRVQPLIEASRRIARGDPALAEEMMARLGATPDEQRRELRRLVEGALSEAGGPTTLPPAMEAELNGKILMLMANVPDRQRAARQALREITASGEWGLSRYGLPPGGAQGMPSGLRARLFGAPQWVRHPPEQHVAPYGRGGEVGARWQEELVQDVLRRQGLSDEERANWVLGGSAFLRPTDRFERVEVEDGRGGRRVVVARLYELWGPVAPGVRNYLGMMGPDGVRTGAPVLIPLEAEAWRHRLRWLQRRAGEEGVARERRDAAAPNEPWPGSVPNPSAPHLDSLRP